MSGHGERSAEKEGMPQRSTCTRARRGGVDASATDWASGGYRADVEKGQCAPRVWSPGTVVRDGWVILVGV